MATSIGKLVVAITAATKPFAKGLGRATGMVSGFASRVGGFAKRIGGMFLSLPGLLTAAFAGIAIGKFLGSGIAAIDAQDEATAKLGAVLKATGFAAGFTTDQLTAQASALQALTTFADEDVINMQALLATFREIKGDNFIAAQKAALDMSSVIGQDLKSSSIQLGKALNDPTKGLSALSRVGVSFTQQQIDQVKAMHAAGDIAGAQGVILAELASEFGGAAEAMAKTPGGMRKQAKNAFGDILEGIGMVANNLTAKFVPGITAAFTTAATWLSANAGKIAAAISGFLAPGISIAVGIFKWFRSTVMPIIPGVVTTIVGWLSGFVSWFVPYWFQYLKTLWAGVKFLGVVVGGVAKAIGGAFGWVLQKLGLTSGGFSGFRDSIVAGLIAVEFGFTRWRDVLDFALVATALKVVEFGAEVAHIFTGVIPSLLSWFGRNWREVMVDWASFTLTVWTNLGKNLWAIMKEIASGRFDFSGVWTPLTEGFEATLSELPQIPERQIGALEASLRAQADALSGGLGDSFEQFSAERMNEYAQNQKSTDAWLAGLGASFADFAVPESMSAAAMMKPMIESDPADIAAGAAKGKQIDMRSTVIDGIDGGDKKKAQEIESPQIDETNSLLAGIKGLLATPAPAVFA